MSKIPDFIIAGMPRAGTTSLSKYLNEHPNICICKPKEPHYFSDDLPEIQRVKNYSDYISLFPVQPNPDSYYGEASTGYLFSKRAIPNALRTNPDIKIIIMLRNPVDMIYSFHAHLLYLGYEDIPDFKKAWFLQEDRKEGNYLPKNKKYEKFLQYRDVASIGSQVKRLLEYVPSKQVKFIMFEDFVTDTNNTYIETLEFLGARKVPLKVYKKYNEYISYWPPYYYQIRSIMPLKLCEYIDYEKRKLGIGVKISRRLFSSKNKPKSMGSNLRNIVLESIHNEIDILMHLTNKDMSHWIINN
ncbi:MAG: hypothetical protein GTO02_08910 [Candidatus Dadabacteria bacterium]|nr:hypothetical protein [Candidatus Dadabacteria bacterium]